MKKEDILKLGFKELSKDFYELKELKLRLGYNGNDFVNNELSLVFANKTSKMIKIKDINHLKIQLKNFSL